MVAFTINKMFRLFEDAFDETATASNTSYINPRENFYKEAEHVEGFLLRLSGNRTWKRKA